MRKAAKKKILKALVYGVGLIVIIILVGLILFANSSYMPFSEHESSTETVGFTDMSNQLSNDETHKSGGHGIAITDIDNDGLSDIMISYNNDKKTPVGEVLYHNLGNMRFKSEEKLRKIEDVDKGSHGIAWADLDNDGDYDLINGGTYEPAKNEIYQNDKNGYFTETELEGYDKLYQTRAVVAFDFDSDGDLDIFANNGYKGSRDSKEEINEFYKNVNPTNMTFVAIKNTVVNSMPSGQGAVAADIDNDGDIDLLAANRNGDLLIAINGENHTFSLKEPSELGIRHKAGDGITSTDVNNDGFLDLLLSSDERAYLYQNDGTGHFEYIRGFILTNGYMGGFADLDNDGDLDLIFAGDSKVFINTGDLKFETIEKLEIKNSKDSRCIAFSDLDNDGDIDFLFTQKDYLTSLFRNDLKNHNNWINIKLTTADGQAGAFGAKVYVSSQENPNKLIGMREAQSTYGYLAQNDPILHFGLGNERRVHIKTVFLSGKVTEQDIATVNQTIDVHEKSLNSMQ